MPTSAKAWDAIALRAAAMDRFLESMRRRCGRRVYVLVTFQAFVKETASEALPNGVPLDEVRSSISGFGRVGLAKDYGLYWRAIRGVGVEFTINRLMGEAWFVALALERSRRSGERIRQLALAAAIGATRPQQKTLAKIAALGEELESLVAQQQTEAGKFLPHVEPADISEMEEEADDA